MGWWAHLHCGRMSVCAIYPPLGLPSPSLPCGSLPCGYVSPRSSAATAPQRVSSRRSTRSASTRRCAGSSMAKGARWTWVSATRRAAMTGSSAGWRRGRTGGTFLTRSCLSRPASTTPTTKIALRTFAASAKAPRYAGMIARKGECERRWRERERQRE